MPGIKDLVPVTIIKNHKGFYVKAMPTDQNQRSARLLPTTMACTDDEGIWWLTAIPKRKESDRENIFDEYCMTDVDNLALGGWAVEEFAFKLFKENDGTGAGPVLIPAMRTTPFMNSSWEGGGYYHADRRSGEVEGSTEPERNQVEQSCM